MAKKRTRGSLRTKRYRGKGYFLSNAYKNIIYDRSRQRRQTQRGGFLNRYDFAYAGRDTVNQTAKHLDKLAPKLQQWNSCNSGIDLVVVLEYTFFQLVPTQNIFLRFTRFRRSYVNHPAVPLTNHCQSYTAFLLDVRCSKWSRSFFVAACPQ